MDLDIVELEQEIAGLDVSCLRILGLYMLVIEYGNILVNPSKIKYQIIPTF